MSTEPRCAFLLVRRDADLAPTSDDLAVYLSILRRWSPSSGGLWIDEEGVANLPSELVLPNGADAQRTVRILEATGINGIWMLCWLDAVATSVSRIDLVAALLEWFGDGPGGTRAARFIPVFADNTPGCRVGVEMQALEAYYPGLARPPIFQDTGGNLILQAARAGS